MQDSLLHKDRFFHSCRVQFLSPEIRIIWLVLLLLLNIICDLLGQQTASGFFRNYTIEQGVPSDYISKVVQGEDGFMWFGTNNGLVRYDGYEFVVYSHNPNNASSISGDYISALAPVNERLMWVGLYEKGLDLFDTQSGKTIFHIDVKSAPELSDNRIQKLWVEEEKNRLWICSMRNHFVWLDLTTLSITVPKLVKHPGSAVEVPETNTIYAIERDRNEPDKYWMATNDGLVLYDENANTSWYHQIPVISRMSVTSNRMRAMLGDGDKIWIGSRGGNGLSCFDIKSKEFINYPYDSNKKVNFVLAISRKSANELWVGSIGSSLMIFNTETKKYSRFKYDTKLLSDLKSDIIFDIVTDNQLNTWFATKKGIAMYSENYQLFRPDSLISPKITNSPNFFKVWSIEEDSSSIYFGCSEADGLIIYDKKTGKQRLKRPAGLLPDETVYIYRMAKGSAGKIWLAALNHLMYFDPEKDNFVWVERPGILGDAFIHSVAVGKNGLVYFGTRMNGLFSYSPKTEIWKNYRTSNSKIVADNYLHDLVIDGNNRLWISSSNGISVLDLTSQMFIKKYLPEDGFKAVFKMTLDENGRLWTTSENDGVMCIDTKTLKVLPGITKQEGLLSNTIEYVVADKEERLWISTHRGLCVYGLKQKSVLLFDSKNGLYDNHIQGASYVLENGNYIQGFQQAFAQVKPEKLTAIKIDNPPTFTHFKIFDLRYPIQNADTLRLKHTQNFFSIGFSALNFSQPEKLKYQYRLIGVNKGWVNANNLRMASYTNVAAGNYVFEIRYAVKGVVEWSLVQRVWIVITPPFYLTWWFVALLVITAICLAYLLYRSQIEKVRKVEEVKSETNRQLAALEMKALRSQMNPHFIFNSLNSIKYYIIRNETALASKYLSRFSKLIRKILANSQTDYIKLSEEIETIELYLEMEKLRFGEKLEYFIEVDKCIDSEMILIPTMLIQPYIENAIWHGIMHKPTNGKLCFSIKEVPENQDIIEVIIADDGIGRLKSERLRSDGSSQKRSLGMRITGERIELLNRFHQKNISVEISDLHPAEDNPGTQVKLTIDIMV
jgi:ligand-binding sensor domain-containing protein